jgi:hypothetical protein
MVNPKLQSDGRTVTVRVPISIRKRGGRKVVLAPNGIEHDPRTLRCQQVDSAMVKALARAFRWREMLESGKHATIVEIAAGERINESYVSRVLRLTLLAPDIIEAVLKGKQPPKMSLALMMRPIAVAWGEQRAALCR